MQEIRQYLLKSVDSMSLTLFCIKLNFVEYFSIVLCYIIAIWAYFQNLSLFLV